MKLESQYNTVEQGKRLKELGITVEPQKAWITKSTQPPWVLTDAAGTLSTYAEDKRWCSRTWLENRGAKHKAARTKDYGNPVGNLLAEVIYSNEPHPECNVWYPAFSVAELMEALCGRVDIEVTALDPKKCDGDRWEVSVPLDSMEYRSEQLAWALADALIEDIRARGDAEEINARLQSS